MFDFDVGKLMIIATIALVVIGPKDLPGVLRQVGQMVGRLRRMAGEFQGQFMDAMKEADLQDIRAEVAKLKDTATLDIDFDPARDIKAHLDDAVATPTASVTVASVGSTSESVQANLPAPSELAAPLMQGTSLAPASEVPPSASFSAGNGVSAPAPAALEVAPAEAPSRRKTVLVRRRVGPRAEPGRPPAWPRSRNILPARRETPEQ